MKRISSASSSVSEKAITVPSISDVYEPKSNPSDVYFSALKVVVLDYINEPRFDKKVVRERLAPRVVSANVAKDQRHKRMSWFSNSTQPQTMAISEEARLLKTTKIQLEAYLNQVALNKKKIVNQNFRRCLLKLHNDLFLDPSKRDVLDHLQKFEELIVYFTKAANNELNKLAVEDVQKELYAQVSHFIDLLITLNPSTNSRAIAEKLHNYKNTVKPNGRTSGLQARSMSPSSLETPKQKITQQPPSFKLSEIPHIEYFSDLFGVDNIQLQQDVIKVIPEATNDIYSSELRLLKEKLKSGIGPLTPAEFVQEADYVHWKEFEELQISILLEKYEKLGRASENIKSRCVIPANPRDIFVNLIKHIFTKECKNNSSTLIFSQEAMFFLSKVAKIWRVDYPTTLASLIYTAANLTVLDDVELNVTFIENLFSMIHLKVFTSDNYLDTSKWNDVDQKQWILNLFHSSRQCMVSIDNLLSALFAQVKPKFSPYLTFYYQYIDSDVALQVYKSFIHDDDRHLEKKFRRTIFKASEQFYISLLEKVPRDKTITIKDIQNVGELIIKELQSLQKRYSKPLLDKVNITHEVATMLITAISMDGPSMIKRVEKYGKFDGKRAILPVDALETYDVFKELRDIYNQVNHKDPFPFDLEKTFGKYIDNLTKEVGSKILNVFVESFKNETWERINPNTSISNSVVDVFKMTNESINMFKNFEWSDKHQSAQMITFLLKSFSDGVQYYSDQSLKLIEYDLRHSSQIIKEKSSPDLLTASQALEEKRKSKWNFHEMKKALISTSSTIIPAAYEFNKRTCIILNDLDAMIPMINDLDERVNPDELSSITNSNLDDGKINTKNTSNMHNVYTIRVIEARDIRGYGSDGLANSTVRLINGNQHRELGVTKLIPRTNNPVWDEEFEIQLLVGQSSTVTFDIWHHPLGRLKSLGSDELCGRAILSLDPKFFTDDGFPNDKTLELDTVGQLFLQVSLETEKMDALFCVGRAYRSLTRMRDRAIELIVNKFSTFVGFAFSRETLGCVTGHHGQNEASYDAIYDAIVPLFDYLNANLNILAKELTQDLLFMVMLRAWFLILKTADSLLLPQLSIAKSKLAQTKKSLWKMSSAPSILGYGRSLTTVEVSIVFKWLDSLCVDFFHNGGEGPPLEDLNNKVYRNLQEIPKYYDKTSLELKNEVKKLTPLYYKHLDKLYKANGSNVEVSRHFTTVERRKTIMASSKKKRTAIEKEIKNYEKDPLERSAETLDIILRILITKGEIDYVYRQLHERKLKKKAINIQNIARNAAMGQKIRYKR